MASSSAPVPASSAAVSSSMGASTSSPCAACKFLRRKCQPDCVFAPYFPPDQPQKFVHVHRVFGASNVTKLLNELHPYQREDAVNSLAYEADMRLRDPVYGCVGVISILQHQLRQLQMDLSCAKSELSKYQSAAGSSSAPGFGAGLPTAGMHGFLNADHHPIGFGREQFFPAGNNREPRPNQHLMMRTFEGELMGRLGANGAYDAAGIVAAMNASAASIGPLGGQFMKPSSAGRDERPSIGPS
ncbi:LOB domain-containing protein 6 [Cocos nucifera]|uniref:LOB domain-containing protein 6 n=1 Tax=Cocos nucifera TaxID=13894 RepID=A0A8K0HXQ6_COCNU|nr:LOB domain-containing protein 6 [Cocos nucifera]